MLATLSVDAPGLVLGALSGLGVSYLVAWLWRPRVRHTGFCVSDYQGGVLYKLVFEVKGRTPPGTCAVEIRWPGNTRGIRDWERTFAKWDETAIPLSNGEFRQELVPSTYFQPLIPNREYAVPVLYRSSDGNLVVFSGWWYGFPTHKPYSAVEPTWRLLMTLSGTNLRSWTFEITPQALLAGEMRVPCPEQA
jgi:hypothetical protein